MDKSLINEFINKNVSLEITSFSGGASLRNTVNLEGEIEKVDDQAIVFRISNIIHLTAFIKISDYKKAIGKKIYIPFDRINFILEL